MRGQPTSAEGRLYGVRMSRAMTAVCLAIMLLTGRAIRSQPQSPPSFEIASVKQNTTGASNVSVGARPGGYVGTNVPLRLLIQLAYRLRPFQVVGGPGWIDSDRFDLAARAPEN